MKTKHLNRALWITAAIAVAASCLPAHAQGVFNKYGPANGVQCNTGATYQDTACAATAIPAAGSSGAMQYKDLSSGALAGNNGVITASDGGLVLGGATGGSQGPGTINAPAMYINGSPVGTSSGAVSSVGLSLPGIFTVTGSPVTAAGTLTGTLATQSANTVFAGPTTGSAAQPAFRALVAADIPALSYLTSVQVTMPSPFAVSGCTITSSGTCNITWATGQTANLFLASPNGSTGAVSLRAMVAADLPSTAVTPGSYTNVNATVDQQGRITAMSSGGASGCSGANPTGVIGLTAVNGSASSCIRSDGAPALSQAITPTWSGPHVFAAGLDVTGAFSGSLAASSSLISQGGNIGQFLAIGPSTSAIGAVSIRGISTNDSVDKAVLTSTVSGGAVTGIAVGNATDAPLTTFFGAVNAVGSSNSAVAYGLNGNANSGMFQGTVGFVSFSCGGTTCGTFTSSTVTFPQLPSSTAATSGYVCASSGALSYDPTNTCLVSSIRYKQDVLPLDDGLAQVMALNPVSYDLKPQYNPAHIGRQIGFIAEDVVKVDPRIVPLDAQGLPRGVQYDRITAMLVKAVQDQQHEIDALKKRKH